MLFITITYTPVSVTFSLGLPKSEAIMNSPSQAKLIATVIEYITNVKNVPYHLCIAQWTCTGTEYG